MSNKDLSILQTVEIVAVYVLAVLLTRSIVSRTLRKARLEKTRRRIIVKAIHLLLTLTAVVLIAGVWGVDQRELAMYAGTTMTVLGIAFFAQWSLLSNVTSGILLVFNHSLKLGDTITMNDKDYPFEGEIVDLSYFFVHLRTRSGQTITYGALARDHRDSSGRLAGQGTARREWLAGGCGFGGRPDARD